MVTQSAPEPSPAYLQLGIEFVRVPAGEFLMGSADAPAESASQWDPTLPPQHVTIREQPQHTVHLDAFEIGRYPITLDQYASFCRATSRELPPPLRTPQPDSSVPVHFVGWWDAAAFCQWLSSLCGEPFRLPTEAEWEKAARGEDGRRFPWGDAPPNAWQCNCRPGTGRATGVLCHPAGASPYGCLDMAGNVWEWCADWYDPDWYQRGDERNPTGPQAGRSRVIRGGAWDSEPYLVRCATRCYDRAYDEPFFPCGFRVVRPVPPTTP